MKFVLIAFSSASPHFVTHMSMIIGNFIYSKGKVTENLKKEFTSVYLAGIKTLRQSETLALPVGKEDFGGIGPGVSNS